MRRRKGDFGTCKVVPKRMLNAFIESELVSDLHTLWETHAYDMLAQYEGVCEGDWEGAGYDLDKEFPQVALLANNYGNEWKAFILRNDQSTLWVVSNALDNDDFQIYLDEFLYNRWHKIQTKKDVDEAIEMFQDIIQDEKEDTEKEEEEED